MDSYKPSKIETKWQKIWRDFRFFSPDLKKSKKPFYNLMMFPYPSAEGLHVGNMYAFVGSDIYGRYMRMRGYNVFEPIGLDGFGIHSENYAIKVGRNPKVQAEISQKNFYRQLKATGNAYDWSRTLETYDPEYYRWTQWIFIQLFKKGLAYRSKSPVNFCPSCKTVLADEQVIDGKCERCSTVVEKKELEQWFFRITDYANRLLEGLSRIDWSERVKIAQRNWIGKSQGAMIKFKIFRGPVSSFPPAPSMNSGQAVRFYPERNRRAAGNPSRTATPQDDFIEVFTTRPDTLFGATFLVLAPEHPVLASLVNKKLETGNWKLEEIREYIGRSQRRSEVERNEGKNKTGVFTGFFAINPINGEQIPIWVADYVSVSYGTGAIMAVPAHDERDFEFATKYKLPVKVVIESKLRTRSDGLEAYAGPGSLVNSGEWNGWEVPKEMPKVLDWLEKKGIGKRESQFHLRDWLISRQRYWGPPIPVIYCRRCWDEQLTINNKQSFSSNKQLTEGVDYAVIDGKKFAIIVVPDQDLPVLLPDVVDWQPKGIHSTSSGEAVKSPLATVESFIATKCPKCGGEARRETDVSDTFLDSAWYFLRYTSIEDFKRPWSPEIVNKWLPVDMYIGGAEHSVLHLLYTRFLTMVFKDLELVRFEEPFIKFRAHGLLISKGAKMSKSKGNIVNPDDYIEKYGSDTLRCYLMFCGRFQQGGDFQDKGIEGIRRFLNRAWRLVGGSVGQWDSGKVGKDNPTTLQPHNPNDLYMMHKAIKQVTEDIEKLNYNTAISALMIWLNSLEKRTTDNLQLTTEQTDLEKGQTLAKNQPGKGLALAKDAVEPITRVEIEAFLKLLAPFAPHLTEELWQKIGSRKFNSIHLQSWPKYDAKLATTNEIELVIQVNGKVRDRVTVMRGISQKEAESLALKSEKARKYLGDKGDKANRVIFVADKLINFVVK